MVIAESVERNGFKRAMLKLGDEMFDGGKVGVDSDVVQNVARQIAEVSQKGVEVCVIIGDGSFFCGTQFQQRGMDRARPDYMGMLGTVMNCLALQDFPEQEGVDCHVQTAINMAQVSESYLPLCAKRRLEKGCVVVFGAGMGMPYFPTDATAVQCVLEIGCEVLLMARTVDDVYSADPREVLDAELFDDITRREVLERDLRVVDATAFSLCMDNNMPILAFNPLTDGSIAHAVAGEQIGTLVHS